jgi:pSer/pThr/pTyr-binding forkhead associated (FHA) protein
VAHTADPTGIAPHDAPTARLPGARPPALIPRLARGRVPPGPHLLLRTGDETELVPLWSEVTHVGRGLTADVRLDDHLVSRRHAIILAGADGVRRILDDRSANGVVLNGRVVTDAELRPGDVIVLGRSVLRYLEG